MILKPLTLVQLNKIFDKTAVEAINFYIQKAIFSQPEPLNGQGQLSIQIPKEHVEQWIVQAIGAKPVGAGSYPVDVIKEGEFGADVKMLSCKVKQGELTNAESGETSLAQKFKETGDDLDTLFKEQKHELIVKEWNAILFSKLKKVLKNDNVKKIYYFFILRSESAFYLCGLDVDVESIFRTSVKYTTKSSIFLDEFIDKKYGNVKIYKSKKRLELRLKPKNWLKENLLLKFDLKLTNREVNIREKIEENKLSEYIYELKEELFKYGN